MSNIDHISQLTPDRENARAHDPRNLGVIVSALQEVGAARSIVIDEDGRVLAGNGVLEAASIAGIENVQVVDADGETIVAVRRTGLTDEQKTRLALYDNRASDLSRFDPAVLAGLAKANPGIADGLWSADEWREVMMGANGREKAEDPGPQIDKAQELQGKWQTATGQLWEIGKHRLICGDCTERAVVERVMDGEKADYFVTDPPYVLQAASDKAKKADQNDQALRHFLKDCWLAILPSMQRYAGAVWFCNWRTIDCVRTATMTRNEKNYQPAIWYKGKGATPGMPWMNTWEMLLFYAVSDFDSKKGTTGMDNFISIPWNGGTRENHPAEKPVEIYEYAMSPMCQGDIVIDPFLGSGTALVACERLGRKGRGVEISPAYCAVALQRLADMGLEPRLLLDTSTPLGLEK